MTTFTDPKIIRTQQKLILFCFPLVTSIFKNGNYASPYVEGK